MDTVQQVRQRESTFHFIVDLLIRPGRAFSALAQGNSRGWLLVGLLVLVFTIAPIIVAAPITRQQIIKTMQRVQTQMVVTPPPGQGRAPTSSQGRGQPPSPQLTPDVTNVVANPLFTVFIPGISVLVGVLIGWLIWAGVLHLLAVFMGGRSAFKTMFAAVVAASLPNGLRGLIQTIYIAASHSLILNPGLSGLVPIGSPDSLYKVSAPGTPPTLTVPVGKMLLHQVLMGVDIFLLWRLFLLGLAVWAVSRLSRKRAYALVVGLWVAFTLLALVPTLISYTMMRGLTGMGG